MDLRTTLDYFAELSGRTEPRLNVLARKGDGVWLGSGTSWRQAKGGDRLRSIDQLHRDENLLRLGRAVAVGRHDGKRVHLPLFSAPCRLERLGGIEVTGPFVETLRPWIVVDEDGDELLEPTEEQIRSAAAIADLTLSAVEAGRTPDDPPDDDTVIVVRGSMLYADRDRINLTSQELLRELARRDDIETTAVAALYGHDPVTTNRTQNRANQRHSLAVDGVRLTPSQQEVVDRARSEPLTVVSGAPGTGKTVTIAAAAMESATAGRPTLIVTATTHAAEVVAGFVDRIPGPAPVRFGDPRQRKALANQLVGGETVESVDVGSIRASWRQTRERLERLEDVVVAQLDGLEQLSRAIEMSADLHGVAGDLPNVSSGSFDVHGALTVVERLLDDRPMARLRRWFDRRRLRQVTTTEFSRDRLEDLGYLLAAECTIRDLPRLDSEQMESTWASMLDASAREHSLAIGLTECEQRDLRRGQARQAGALAAALRSTASVRQLMLANLDANQLVDAFPIWIGTLAECEQVLPRNSTPFDLVVVDEASQVAQPDLVGALSRGRRAVICGDPHQLRHVSFVGVDAMTTAAARVGLDLAPVNDIRAVSAFDAAATRSTPIRLDQHFRSAPHLIGFNADRFYDRELSVMTVRPGNADADRIHVHQVAGATDERVDQAEIAASLDLIERLADAGATSLGIVTPFRAVADELEAAALERWTPSQTESMRLQLGTVHSFQGSERDVVVAVLGLSDNPTASDLRWLQQPDLFNVMTTRARQHLHILSRVDPDSLVPGVLRDYLAWAETTDDVTRTSPASRWTTSVADALAELGHRTLPRYEVGTWHVDLALPDAGAAIGVESTLHAAGARATLQQRRVLSDLGWTILPIHEASWADQPTDAALYVARRLRQLDS